MYGPEDLSGDPIISVIVTAYDYLSENSIHEVIDSLNNQTYKNIELILVIEGSKELSESVRKYVTSKNIGLVKVYEIGAGAGASASRNYGIENASGEVIAFVDDDVVLSNEWANCIIQTFDSNDSYIGAIGPVMPLWNDPSMDWFPAEMEWLISCTGWFQYKGVLTLRGHTWTSNAAFRKEAFEEGTLFSENLGPIAGLAGWKRGAISEDVELSMRIQMRTGKLVVYNSEMLAWKQIKKGVLSWTHIKDCAFGIGLSRVTKKWLSGNSQYDSLALESNLLERVFFKLVPNILVNWLSDRKAARHSLSIIVFTIFFLGMGYIYGTLILPFKLKRY